MGDLNMADDKPTPEVDVTKEWRATQGQKSAATRLRIFAAIAWVIAIGTEGHVVHVRPETVVEIALDDHLGGEDGVVGLGLKMMRYRAQMLGGKPEAVLWKLVTARVIIRAI